jgi:hypothetical protein
MKWHATLSSYGIVGGLEGHEDADIELLNKVVEKVVLKRIKNLLDTMNPVSSQETRYAVHAVEQVSYYVEKHEHPFQVSCKPYHHHISSHTLSLSLSL